MRSFQNLVDELPMDLRYRLPEDAEPWGELIPGECIFGANGSECRGTVPLEQIPADTTAFSFLLGPGQLQLVEAFVRSEFASRATTLRIGTSEVFQGDYSPVVAALNAAELPNLAQLDLGVFLSFDNHDGELSTIGELGPLLDRVPSLKELRLYGNWSLDRCLDLSRLSHLEIEVPNYGDQNRVLPVDQGSLTRMLDSKLPTCPTYFALHTHMPEDAKRLGVKPVWHEVSSNFWSWEPENTIQIFGLSGCFAEGTAEQFVNSSVAKRITELNYNVTLEQLWEPDTTVSS